MRKKYHHKGDQHILDVLHDEPRGGRPMKFDSTVESKVTMIACSEPPPGAARWTLHLIADRLVKLDVVDTISHESVRTILKKQIETLASGTMVHWANYGELSVAYGRCTLAVCLTI